MTLVQLPGTSGMKPLVNRFLSCLWVEHDGVGILIDCGEGTQIALASANIRFCKLDYLLITHYHADHISGIIGLLLTVSTLGKTSPLHIYGPVGTKKVIDSLLIIARQGISYELIINEIDEEIAEIPLVNDITLWTRKLRHTTRCLGYKIVIKRKPIFNPQKAEELKIPVQYYKKLHANEITELPDGRVIYPSDVLDGRRKPFIISMITDTISFTGIAKFVQNSTLLVCEGLHGDSENFKDTRAKGHMNFEEAAKIAFASDSERLWLTHYSPAMAEPKFFIKNAKRIFENTELGFDGKALEIK